MVQLSTNLFYQRSASSLGALSARADKLNEQLSTTKRLSAPSDDSVAFQRLQGLARQTADSGAYASNLSIASGVLSQADTALTAITDQLQQASELAVRAGNGTLNAADRTFLGAQLGAIVDTLVGLANGTDSRGQPLFGDASGGPAVTRNADGGFTLAQTTGSAIPIGGGQSIQTTEPAARMFALGDRNTLTMLAELATALQSGEPPNDSVKLAVSEIAESLDQVGTVQSSLGARAARVEMETARLADSAIDREAARSALEDTDIATTVAELQKTMTVLSVTQASFAKLSSLSLFDYLR